MSATTRSLTRALSQYREGKLRAAWVTCHKVIQRTPGDPAAHVLLGRIALDQGKPDIASHHLEPLRRALAT